MGKEDKAKDFFYHFEYLILFFKTQMYNWGFVGVRFFEKHPPSVKKPSQHTAKAFLLRGYF
jgi:hypothetical protein